MKLVSTPTVPDSEKLSWLVRGHGMDASSGQDFSALQLTAGTLLAAGEHSPCCSASPMQPGWRRSA